MEETNIYSFGFDKNLQRKTESGVDTLELLEDKIERILQSGETITTSIPGLKETEYNGI